MICYNLLVKRGFYDICLESPICSNGVTILTFKPFTTDHFMSIYVVPIEDMKRMEFQNSSFPHYLFPSPSIPLFFTLPFGLPFNYIFPLHFSLVHKINTSFYISHSFLRNIC